MGREGFILKGDICCSKSRAALCTLEQAYLIVEEGKIAGVYPVIPEQFSGLQLRDMGDAIILPGMTDLHLHAPQYGFRGTGMDLELLDWLNTCTFPEEAKYSEQEYAESAYSVFAEDLRRSATTRALVFSTIHRGATELLMEKLERSGVVSLVGKVNMDRNSPETLSEHTATEALRATEDWIRGTRGKYRNTGIILTPRFTPSCSDALLRGLGELRERYHLPVQSHLSENLSEIAWVQELCPWSTCYGDTYRHFGLLGGPGGSVMAHCVHSSEEEIRMLRESGCFIAHCPQSNANLSSGIAPVRRYLELGMKVGLGTDVAGGANLSMLRCITDAIMASKLRWRIVDQTRKPLRFEEAFYLATRGGGEFFGKVGGFERGCEADILIFREKRKDFRRAGLADRLQQLVYGAEERSELVSKYVRGRQLF